MKRRSGLYCPGCASELNRETALRSEGYVGFEGWKALQCPCCNFFVQSDPERVYEWADLEAIAISKGATHQPIAF